MHHFTSSKRSITAVAALSLLLVGLLLSACGSSSTPRTSSTAAAASATTGTSGSSTAPGSSNTTAPAPTRSRGGRFAALRACLAKNGITLPRPTRGKGPAGGFLGGAVKRPSGVSRGQYEAAVKKCGGKAGGAARRFKSFSDNPKAKAALTRFAACMRGHGVDLPAPNTSGPGPIFNTSGVNVSGAKFKAAEVKCSVKLRGAFGARRRPPGTGHPPAANGAPPAD